MKYISVANYMIIFIVFSVLSCTNWQK